LREDSSTALSLNPGYLAGFAVNEVSVCLYSCSDEAD
jgi:hypothetical protein